MPPDSGEPDKPAQTTGPAGAGQMDAQLLEQLRRSGIRIDRAGEFQHEGAPVRHEGLRRALFRWLDRLPDGRTILRLDERRFVYVDVDDTPLVAGGARIAGDRLWLALSDGSEEPIDPLTLKIDHQGIMRCWVKGGRLQARLATSAATVLADLVEDRPQGPTLVLGAASFVIGRG